MQMRDSFLTWILNNFYKESITRISTTENKLYLTFDDGPHATITPWVLDLLKTYNAKASFFCLGKNVATNSEIYQRIKNEGHTIGNHSYSHFNGFTTGNKKYYNDIEQAAKEIQSKFYRPPYGSITPLQYQYLKKQYRIVMWDVITWDFDTMRTWQQCYDNTIKQVQPGSVVVMHDSEKAFGRLEKLLPQLLEYYSQRNFIFDNIKTQ